MSRQGTRNADVEVSQVSLRRVLYTRMLLWSSGFVPTEIFKLRRDVVRFVL